MIEDKHGLICTTFDFTETSINARMLPTSTGETLNDDELDDLCDIVMADLAMAAHV